MDRNMKMVFAICGMTNTHINAFIVTKLMKKFVKIMMTRRILLYNPGPMALLLLLIKGSKLSL